MASGTDVVLRALGAALAGISIAFAGCMFAYGDGKVRVFGMDHLAIFAQPRGAAIIAASPPGLPPANEITVDMAATGSVAELASKARTADRPEIVAARSDRIWVRMDGKIIAFAPGEDLPRLGRIGTILPREGGWTVLDDKGAMLMTLAGPANGAALFSRKLIFD